jgi:hypothetical protein
MNDRDVFWGFIVFMLIFLLFIQMKPFGLFEEDKPADFADFDKLHEIADNVEKLVILKNDLTEQLADANQRIKTLEETDWHTKYELTKGELEKERDSHPNHLITAYVSGFTAFLVVFFFTWIYRNKEYSDLKRKTKEAEKKAEQLEIALLAEKNKKKGGKK